MDPPLRRGEQVWLAGLTTGHRMMRRQCTVTTATCAMTIAPATVPRFRAVHEEVCLVPLSLVLSSKLWTLLLIFRLWCHCILDTFVCCT